MRLDQTRIAIRERTLLDILDMALRVFAQFFRPIMACGAVVAIPLMVFNWWMLKWMLLAGEVEPSRYRYLSMMFVLVVIESPLVSLAITPFLGHVMFMEAVTPRKIVSTIAKSWLPLFIALLLWRGILFAWWMIASVPPTELVFSTWEGWLIPLAILVVIIRASRPFITEIILLERNPMRSKDKREITIGRRSSTLHGPNSGDLIGRWMGNSVIAAFLGTSLLASIWFAWGMLAFDWNWGWGMMHVWYPATLWIVAIYFSVVRFLCYLDLRIRREGWEVELIMRAAVNRRQEALR